MSSEQNLKKIKEMCLKNGISEGKTSKEYLFTLNSIDFYYFNRNIGEIDIVEGFVDGSNDGGIDFILNKEDTMYLVQGKSSNKLSLEDIKNSFNKMCDTIEKFENGDINSFHQKLKSIYLNKYEDLSEDKNIELVLFTNTTFSENILDEIEKYKNSDRLSSYKVSFFDGSDIEKKIIVSYQGNEFVQEDSIELCETNNRLEYGEGVIVNIKASSLKKLFIKYSQKGLFSFNLREHISQKSVDNGIDETIKNDPKNFWYYNNGITLGCVDYNIDGNKIKLYDFSIINGAQTTTKIGNSKIINADNDFAIVCKIVKAKGSLQDSRDFISKISEASNSQKPIRFRDLKANAIEQKRLQILASQNNYPLSIEIKRGVKPLNEKKVNNKWQKVTNEYIGQLILSCILQKPGTARSGKMLIFSSEKIYNQIYKRKHDYDTLYDLVRIANLYDNFKLDYLKEEEDSKKIAVSQNGKFTVLAVLFYFYKRLFCGISGFSDSKVVEDNIKGLLTLEYNDDNYEKKIYYLFKFIVNRLSDLYDIKETDLKLTSYSNFFKTDKTYIDVILYDMDRLLSDEYDFNRIKEYMIIFEKKREYAIS